MSEEIREMLSTLEEQTEALAKSGGSSVHEAADALVNTTASPSIWTPEIVLILAGAILLFGLFTMMMMGFLLYKGHDTRNMLRLFALPLIIVSAIFLIVAGYTQDQIAPVMGLLGTIAGYLLGNTEGRKSEGKMDGNSG